MHVKLVAFDFYGTLTKNSISTWKVAHSYLGTLEEVKKHEEMFLKGEIDSETWAKLDVEVWVKKKVRKKDFVKAFENVTELREDAKQVVAQLKNYGIKVVIITGAFNVVVEPFAKYLGVDKVFSTELEFDSSGFIKGMKAIYDFEGKTKALEEAAKLHSVNLSETAVVGDSGNDYWMFKKSGLSVAFNPKSKKLEEVADFVVKSDKLAPVLDVLLSEKS